MSDLKQRALALYKPPFRRVHGYIYDADSRVVADDAAAKDEEAALRIRGWGRIQYLADPEALQDAAGDLIAEALTEYWQRRTQPEATAPAQDLSAAILALRPEEVDLKYQAGHYDARHAAAALASAPHAQAPAAPVAEKCTECGDVGVVGHPPDDYFNCPKCTPPAAQPQPVAEQGELPPLPNFAADVKFARLIDAQNKAIKEWAEKGGSTEEWVGAMHETSDYLRGVMRDYARAAIAASQPHDADAAKRLRLICKLVGIESHVPADDETLWGAAFAVLGQIRAALEAIQQAAELNGKAQAIKAAVAAIYFDDSSDFGTALWEVVKALDPAMAELLEENPSAAYHQSSAANHQDNEGEKA